MSTEEPDDERYTKRLKPKGVHFAQVIGDMISVSAGKLWPAEIARRLGVQDAQISQYLVKKRAASPERVAKFATRFPTFSDRFWEAWRLDQVEAIRALEEQVRGKDLSAEYEDLLTPKPTRGVVVREFRSGASDAEYAAVKLVMDEAHKEGFPDGYIAALSGLLGAAEARRRIAALNEHRRDAQEKRSSA